MFKYNMFVNKIVFRIRKIYWLPASFSTCWGSDVIDSYALLQHEAMVKCGAIPSETRTKRAADGYEIHTDADIVKFGKVIDTKVGNLTCVMKELDFLDEAGKIKPNTFSLLKLQEEYSNTPAGADPVFLKKYSYEMTNCYNIAMSWPVSALKSNAFLAKHGRKMVYFKCIKQTEINLCAKYQMVGFAEAATGIDL